MGKILVTGGAGFIGSHLVDLLLAKGEDVVVVDNFSAGDPNNLAEKKIKLFDGDIRDKKLMDTAMADVETVFHLAAAVWVQESIAKPRDYFDVNTIGTLTVLESAVKNRVNKIVYLNTASIYKSNEKMKIDETMDLDPLHPYAISKLDGEYLIKMFNNLYGLNYCILRAFNPYGTRMKENGVVSIFLNRAVKDEDIYIYGDGKQIRDFIHVSDLVAAAYRCKEQGSGVYNVGSGDGVALASVLEQIIEIAGSKSNIVYKSGQKGEIKYSVANISKITNELPWRPQISLACGIKSMIKEAMALKEKEAHV